MSAADCDADSERSEEFASACGAVVPHPAKRILSELTPLGQQSPSPGQPGPAFSTPFHSLLSLES